jgi:hypothetical protein
MYITKIKRDTKTNRVTINWLTSLDDDAGVFSYNKPRTIPPSFESALLDLREHVSDMTEIYLQDDELHKIEIIGVTFSWTNENMGATITAKKQLENSDTPLLLNTPHKFEDGDSDKKLLPGRCVDALIKVMDEAKAFINSEETQIELFPKGSAVAA